MWLPLRQLSLGETLGKTITIFFGRLDIFLPLALAVTVPLSLTTILFVASLADVKNDEDVWDYFGNHLASCLSYVVFQAMLYVILFFAMEAAMVRAAAEILGKTLHVLFSVGRSDFLWRRVPLKMSLVLCSTSRQIAPVVCLFLSRPQQVWFALVRPLARVVLSSLDTCACRRTQCSSRVIAFA